MKKLMLVMVAVMLGFTATAQDGFRAGVNVGFPSGDASDWATFAIAVDLGYLFDVSDNFQAGVATGYSHSFGDEFMGVELDDASFLPLAASGRLALGDSFGLGADVGYAIGISPDGNDGGFYYAPRLSYGVSDAIDIVAAYRGVSIDGGSWDLITLGIEFGL